MKNKLFKSLLVFILLIFLGVSHELISRKASQDYSAAAAQQFTNDNAYYTLQTQHSAINFIDVVFVAASLASLSLFYFIWKTKKEDEIPNIEELKEDELPDIEEKV